MMQWTYFIGCTLQEDDGVPPVIMITDDDDDGDEETTNNRETTENDEELARQLQVCMHRQAHSCFCVYGIYPLFCLLGIQ